MPPAPDQERLYAIATANRLLAAEMFAGLTPQQWATPSLCRGWTVREVAAHLLPPANRLWLLPLAVQVIRHRGDLERMVDENTRRAAELPVDEIVRRLRDRAGVRLKPPVTGVAGPMADTAIHLRDAARPLGLAVNPEPPTWEPVLDFLVSTPAGKGFVPPDRLRGLRFVVDDGTWSWGDGATVSGTSEAVAMAIAGRAAVLPELAGDGVALLAGRLPADR
jgi:uncharacterized protein (TIGR03083 family)